MGILSIWSSVCSIILKAGEPLGDGSQLVETGPAVQGFDIDSHPLRDHLLCFLVGHKTKSLSCTKREPLPPPCLPTKVSRDSLSYLCCVFGHRGWKQPHPLIWPSPCLASLTTPASFKVNVASFTFFFFFLKEMVQSLPFMDILTVGRKYHFVPILLRLTHQEMGFGSLSKVLLVPSKKIKWFSFWLPLTLNYRFPNRNWDKLYSE